MAHEFSSSRIFFGGNSFYLRKFPRRIVLIKGFLTILPLLSFFGLITIRRRMATLPLLNFVQKSYIFVLHSYIVFEPSLNVLSVFLGEAYSMLLYSRTQQSRFFRIRSHLSFSAFARKNFIFYPIRVTIFVSFISWFIFLEKILNALPNKSQIQMDSIS